MPLCHRHDCQDGDLELFLWRVLGNACSAASSAARGRRHRVILNLQSNGRKVQTAASSACTVAAMAAAPVSAFSIARRRDDGSGKRPGDRSKVEQLTAVGGESSAVRRSKRLKGFSGDEPDGSETVHDAQDTRGEPVCGAGAGSAFVRSSAAPSTAQRAPTTVAKRAGEDDVPAAVASSGVPVLAQVSAVPTVLPVVPPSLPGARRSSEAGGSSSDVQVTAVGFAPPRSQSPVAPLAVVARHHSVVCPNTVKKPALVVAGLAAGMWAGPDRLHPASRPAKGDTYEKQEKIGEVRTCGCATARSPSEAHSVPCVCGNCLWVAAERSCVPV